MVGFAAVKPQSSFGGRLLTLAGSGLLAALACSTPHYEFVPDAVDHCQNHQPDPGAGESDLDCGGPDCHGCALGAGCNESSDCADGECIMGLCQQPGCDNSALDGDETGIDCGGSCAPCRDGQSCLTALDCKNKVCGDDGLCASATCSDGVRNGDERGVDCGGSFCDDGCGIGSPCGGPDDCQSALCDETSQTCALNCTNGTAECDGNLDEPCETNVLASSKNCGKCGSVCELPHANSSCTGGTCQIDDCVKPWIRCNVDDSDGCEINANSDAMNCGACGSVCSDLHGSPSCVGSRCVIECDEGFGDCDGDPATGCETSTNDVDHCGACDKACPTSLGVPNCVKGKCGHTDCDAGFGDCDGDETCETNFEDDPQNCGRCGNICSVAHGTADCVGGQCVVKGCDDGRDNCDASADDGGYSTGCETNVLSDAQHCGGCDKRCDTLSHGSGSCQAGVCALDCDTNFADCDGKLDDGCEVDATSDAEHCGGCNNACDIPNATAACVSSSCVIDHCAPNFADCNAAEGCETDVSSSVQHCGSCNGTCSNAGATKVSCSNGKCDAPTCDGSHRSCDGKNENGCETDITTAANCGACGNACGAATPTCVQSGTNYACQAKITLAASAPYPTALAAAGSLSFNVTPRAGTNRLVLLALVSDSMTNNASNGINGSRPGSVKFGSQAMSAGPSQAGTSDPYSPDLFVYYLPLGDSATDQAQLTVTISGSSGPANFVVAQELELNGARQSMPITAFVGGFVGTPDPDDPGVANAVLPVATSGSFLYDFISDYWDTRTCAVGTASSGCPAWSVAPSTNLTLIETMATAPLTFYPPGTGSAPMRAFGMSVTAASPLLPAAGTYTLTWSEPNPGRLTHLALAIAPAQSP